MASDWPTLAVGSKGVDVRTVQHLLSQQGQAVAADGVYGPVTQAAVTDFQGDKGLVVDGVVGPTTWTALILPVSGGSSGQAVVAVQGQLRSQGWHMAVDGTFGPQTTETVRDFQVARCLLPDGVVGPVTWRTLVADFVRLASPEAAANHLRDASASGDRLLAVRNATLAAADTLLRRGGGGGSPITCSPNPQLGPEAFDCVSHFEGGATHYNVEGDPTDGYFVESIRFFVD